MTYDYIIQNYNSITILLLIKNFVRLMSELKIMLLLTIENDYRLIFLN